MIVLKIIRRLKVLMDRITKIFLKVEQLQRRGSKKDSRLSSRRSSDAVEVKKPYSVSGQNYDDHYVSG